MGLQWVNFTAAKKECLSGEFRCLLGVKQEGGGGGGGGGGGEEVGQNNDGVTDFCIGYFLKCDGKEDCVNGTDELDCELSKFKVNVIM